MNPKLKYLYALAAILMLCGFKYSNREGGEIACTEQMETLHYKITPISATDSKAKVDWVTAVTATAEHPSCMTPTASAEMEVGDEILQGTGGCH